MNDHLLSVRNSKNSNLTFIHNSMDVMELLTYRSILEIKFSTKLLHCRIVFENITTLDVSTAFWTLRTKNSVSFHTLVQWPKSTCS